MPSKHTKIVCTIGPASHDPAMLENMIKAGMNVARLNFSHGTHEDHAKMISIIKEAAAKAGATVGLLQDLQGPKIRVGDLPKDGIMLVKDETVVFTTDAAAEMPKIPVTYDKLHQDVHAGDVILLDDGLLEVHVTAVEGQDIVTKVVNGGPLTSHKGFNLPTASLSVPSVTAKDAEDLKFGVAQHVDWVALSFVRTAQEIHDVRKMIAGYEQELGITPEAPIRICAKIEKHEAIKNIDEIIEAVDAIMVARGDLGIETPAEEVPMVQKRIIEKCLVAAKPVIVATQMLDSMIRNPRPTRAEVSDVANAVIDHTDAVMLSGESASGKYPLEAVETMAKIIRETEASHYDDLPEKKAKKSGKRPVAEAMSDLANTLSHEVDAALILVTSSTGATARFVSRHRPDLPIVAITHSDRVRNQLVLSWGVTPFTVGEYGNVSEMLALASPLLAGAGLAKSGDKVIVVAGGKTGVAGSINMVEVRELP